MTENLCSHCQTELKWAGNNADNDSQYVCPSCQHKYLKISHCPDCQHKLTKLNACGAASYFCDQCNELKSKSRVQAQLYNQQR